MRVFVALAALSLLLVANSAEAHWSNCGNGRIDYGEQCDPGSEEARKTGSSGCCDSESCQFAASGTACGDDYEECTADVCNAVGECTHESPVPPLKGCGCCQYPAAKYDSRHTSEPTCEEDDQKDCEYAKGVWVAGGICDPSGGCIAPAYCGNGVVDPGEECDAGAKGSACCVDCKLAAAGTLCSDDGNFCTDDACDASGVCRHTDNSKPCDDGQLCTKDDVCRKGLCYGSAWVPPACADSNPCTDDLCNPSLGQGHGGCTHSNNTAPCDDGKFCTVTDVCSAGQCTSGSARDCGAGLACIVPKCDEANDRCANQPDPAQNGQTCDDGNACTSGTRCSNGSCSGGSSLACNDSSTCTSDSCNPASGCVFTTVVETPVCQSCLDGVDNDNDGNSDAEDKGCATLSELQRFAVISTATSGRDPLYTGSDVAVDAIAGSTAGSTSPYPLGNSRAGVCAFDGAVRAGGNFGIFATRGTIEFGSGSTLDPTLDDPEVDNGGVRSIDMRTQFVSDNSGEIYKTIAPLVGPGSCSNDNAMCTESQASCTSQSAGACCSGAGALCNGRLRLDDVANPYVDRSGTAENFQRCVTAMDAMLADSQAVATLSGNVAGYMSADEFELRTGVRNPAATIDVGGNGLRVLEVVRVILAGHTSLTINGPADAVVVIRVARQLRLGGEAVISLTGGLRPENVLWNVEGRFGGMPNFDRGSQISGTILAPQRRGIRCGGDVQISGALYAPRVHLGAATRISHRPFLGLVQ